MTALINKIARVMLTFQTTGYFCFFLLKHSLQPPCYEETQAAMWGSPHGGELRPLLTSSTNLPFMWRSHLENGSSSPSQASLAVPRGAEISHFCWALLKLHSCEQIIIIVLEPLSFRGACHTAISNGVSVGVQCLCSQNPCILPMVRLPFIFMRGTNPIPTLSTCPLNRVDTISASRDKPTKQPGQIRGRDHWGDFWNRVSKMQ